MSAAIQVKKPDGTNAGLGVPVRVINDNPDPNYTTTQPKIAYLYTNSSGFIAANGTGMLWPNPIGFPDANRSTTFTVELNGDHPLTYSSVGNTISGYSVYPGINTVGVNPRSFMSVYVSHVNPLFGGPDLLPLYRLSRRCGDFSSPICDTPGASNYNPFHVSHVYTTDKVERDSLKASPNNYKFDGIDGYVFPKSYANAPVAGAVYLCRLTDPVRN